VYHDPKSYKLYGKDGGILLLDYKFSRFPVEKEGIIPS